jgi:hypothetical protein
LLRSLNPTKPSSNLSHNYSWPQFPPGLEQSGCLHWIPCTGYTENWISDSVSAFTVVYCSFVIHKLVEEILQIIKHHILYDSLVHRLYKGCHIWRKLVGTVTH